MYNFTVFIYTSDPELTHLLEYRFHRVRKFGIISDIYDGEEYAKYSEFFESPYNVSFALNSLGPVIILRNGMRKEITSSECESEALRNTLNRVIVAVKKMVLLTAFQAAFHGSALLLSAFLDVLETIF